MGQSLALLIGTAGLLSCRSVPHAPNDEQLMRLPIRFHLLASSNSSALTTTWTDRDVHTLLHVVNGIWRQAGIEWYAESIIREQSPGGANFDSLIADRIPRTEAALTGFVPRRQLLRPGWNVFLIRDFGRIAGGMFQPEIFGVVLSQHGFGFELPADGRGGATLAHELGHSLGLAHVACDSSHDIMANACWSPTAQSTLTRGQIATARQQARKGVPAASIPSP